METENLNQNQNDPGIIIPGERADIENRARSSGWVSKEEFEADERNEGKKWRDADEFLERGEFLSTIKSLKHEVAAMKRDFNLLAQHHKDVAKVEYERAVKDIKAQRAQAAEEGDTKAVVELSDQLDELKADYEKVKQEHQKSGGTVHPAFQEWIQENMWYQTDPALRGAADGVAQAYISQNPNSPFEEVLAHVSEKMSQFLSKPSKARTSTVESGTNRGTSSGKKAKLTKADLNAEELEVMSALVRRKVFANEQEYIDELAKVKGL